MPSNYHPPRTRRTEIFRGEGKHREYRLHKGASSGAVRAELWRSFVKQLRPRKTLRAGRAALPAYVFHYATILASTPLASQVGARHLDILHGQGSRSISRRCFLISSTRASTGTIPVNSNLLD